MLSSVVNCEVCEVTISELGKRVGTEFCKAYMHTQEEKSHFDSNGCIFIIIPKVVIQELLYPAVQNDNILLVVVEKM